ncbi:hypothetical protein [Ktedonospora formicarum]|uniref:hypothetical protein n=1 Tax=Ktedonospora formicarum TaxID=2778364 RepID=UPI001C68F328|nr:hypothetical protein [Ktedonospora formicarum]
MIPSGVLPLYVPPDGMAALIVLRGLLVNSNFLAHSAAGHVQTSNGDGRITQPSIAPTREQAGYKVILSEVIVAQTARA